MAARAQLGDHAALGAAQVLARAQGLHRLSHPEARRHP